MEKVDRTKRSETIENANGKFGNVEWKEQIQKM